MWRGGPELAGLTSVSTVTYVAVAVAASNFIIADFTSLTKV